MSLPCVAIGNTLCFLMTFFSHRLSFLQSLLEPESQKHEWLEAALTHDAPQPGDTMTPEGNPRSGLVRAHSEGPVFLCYVESL